MSGEAGRWKENGESASRMEKSSHLAKDHHGTIFQGELNRGSISGLLVKKESSANLSRKPIIRIFWSGIFDGFAQNGFGDYPAIVATASGSPIRHASSGFAFGVIVERHRGAVGFEYGVHLFFCRFDNARCRYP